MAVEQRQPLRVWREMDGETFSVFSDEEETAIRESAEGILVKDIKLACAKEWQLLGCVGAIEWEHVAVLASPAVFRDIGAILPPEISTDSEVEKTELANTDRIPLRYFEAVAEGEQEAESAGVSFCVKRLFEPFESRKQLDAACYTALKSMLPGAEAEARQAMKAVEEKHGPLRIWDVSKVARLDSLFFVADPVPAPAPIPAAAIPGDEPDDPYRGCADFLVNGFNPDLSGWKTGGVETMGFMFCDCAKFTGVGLEHWDVSSVTFMGDMFRGCLAFDAPLDGWSTANVKDMSHMFRMTSLSHSLNWDCSSCTDMQEMFAQCRNFNTSTRFNFKNTGRVKSMREMFREVQAFAWSCVLDWDIGGLQTANLMFWDYGSPDHACAESETGAIAGFCASDKLLMKEKGWPEDLWDYVGDD
mmetsp:Transcript_20526/g.51822  ORF Transcript_20526/g.51822 Transcript_20526/m.51822 type:complete len:416 (-) Transcript_20526:368-1615(-)